MFFSDLMELHDNSLKVTGYWLLLGLRIHIDDLF